MSRKGTNSSESCKLCEVSGELKDSHLFPRFTYKLVRNSSFKLNPNPVAIHSGQNSSQKSFQMKERMLCENCEDLLNKNGERYFSSLFRQNLLESISTVRASDLGYFASTASTRELLESDKILYFASSIFWRFNCSTTVRQFKSALGPYEVDFRRFLLGLDNFPSNAAIHFVVLQDNQNVRKENDFYFNGLSLPHTARHGSFRLHRFWIAGLMFDLYIGKKLPAEIKSLCYASNYERLAIVARPNWFLSQSYTEKWLGVIASSSRPQNH